MNYIDLNIRTNDSEQSEIFIAQLSDWPFDSFDDQEGTDSKSPGAYSVKLAPKAWKLSRRRGQPF